MGRFFGETSRCVRVGGLTLSENQYLPDQSTPPHTHDTTLFYFVLEGCCSESAVRQERIHLPATLVVLPAGETHATRWAPESGGRCFHLELAPTDQTHRHLHGGYAMHQSGPPTALMRRLYQEFLGWDAYSPLIAEGIVLELLGNLARHQDTTSTQAASWLGCVEATLRENLATPPTLTELSALVEIHPSHLVRAFRQHYHTTPGEFVRQLRIFEACHRLRTQPELSLAELAQELGFADQSHFSRTFRKHQGVSPHQFRKSASKMHSSFK
ncbi:MAG: AraC family transcriptional regulator [Armatimonadetes bacterium]|nr:AraC family transcriptional regulator [Armatimonadota bacterium]